MLCFAMPRLEGEPRRFARVPSEVGGLGRLGDLQRDAKCQSPDQQAHEVRGKESSTPARRTLPPRCSTVRPPTIQLAPTWLS